MAQPDMCPWITEFDGKLLRGVFGAFPTGVAIVTTVTGEQKIGMTISSFSCLSLAPPLILFSIARSAQTIEQWSRAGGYVINFLSQEQETLSARFGRSLAATKWDDVEYEVLGNGVMFPGSLAVLNCAAEQQFEGGDHLIFVARVLAARTRDVSATSPLLHFGGRYRRIAMPDCHSAQAG